MQTNSFSFFTMFTKSYSLKIDGMRERNIRFICPSHLYRTPKFIQIVNFVRWFAWIEGFAFLLPNDLTKVKVTQASDAREIAHILTHLTTHTCTCTHTHIDRQTHIYVLCIYLCMYWLRRLPWEQQIWDVTACAGIFWVVIPVWPAADLGCYSCLC